MVDGNGIQLFENDVVFFLEDSKTHLHDPRVQHLLHPKNCWIFSLMSKIQAVKTAALIKQLKKASIAR